MRTQRKSVATGPRVSRLMVVLGAAMMLAGAVGHLMGRFL
jgi:hypothetical protein